MSLPSNTRFIRVNTSDYPAYGVYIQLYDDTDKINPIRYYGPTEMAAHIATIDEQAWAAKDDIEHHFTARIST